MSHKACFEVEVTFSPSDDAINDIEIVGDGIEAVYRVWDRSL